MTKTIFDANKKIYKTIFKSKKILKLPLLELARADKKLIKDEKSSAASGVARAVITAENSAQRIKSASSKTSMFNRAVATAAKSSEALVKVAQRAKATQERIGMASAKTAMRFARSTARNIEREAGIMYKSAKAAKKLNTEAEAIKLVTQKTDTKSVNFVHRKTNRVMKKSISGLKRMLYKLGKASQSVAQKTEVELQEAEQAAAKLASKDKRSHERINRSRRRRKLRRSRWPAR